MDVEQGWADRISDGFSGGKKPKKTFLLNAEVPTAVQIKVKPMKWNGTKTLKRKI